MTVCNKVNDCDAMMDVWLTTVDQWSRTMCSFVPLFATASRMPHGLGSVAYHARASNASQR
jgi:hypothetical protein